MFLKISDLLTLNNKMEHSRSRHVMDGNDGTCFGLKDRESNIDLSDDVSLYLTSTRTKDPVLNMKVKNVTDCSVFRQEVIISTLLNARSVCPHQTECEIVSDAVSVDVCTVSCPCETQPCVIHLWFTTKSEAEICEIIWK